MTHELHTTVLKGGEKTDYLRAYGEDKETVEAQAKVKALNSNTGILPGTAGQSYVSAVQSGSPCSLFQTRVRTLSHAMRPAAIDTFACLMLATSCADAKLPGQTTTCVRLQEDAIYYNTGAAAILFAADRVSLMFTMRAYTHWRGDCAYLSGAVCALTPHTFALCCGRDLTHRRSSQMPKYLSPLIKYMCSRPCMCVYVCLCLCVGCDEERQRLHQGAGTEEFFSI